MNQTTNVYQYINYFFLAVSLMYWTTDIPTSQFLFLIGMAGTITVLIINNFYPHVEAWTIVAYLLFILSIGSLQSFGTILVFVIAYLVLRPPMTFLMGVIYTFWLFYLSVFGIDYFMQDLPFEFLYTYNNDLIVALFQQWFWVFFLGGYLTSVIPHYVNQGKIHSTRYYNVSSTIVFFVTIPLQLVVGIGMAIFFHSKKYLNVFRQIVRKQTMEEAETNVEPALENYWFEKSFSDWKQLFILTRLENKFTRENAGDTVKEFQSEYHRAFYAIPVSVLDIARFSTIILEFSLLMITSLIHLVIISIIFIPVFVYYSIFHLYDTYYLRTNKVATICPSCYHHSQLPDYVCPQCDREHHDLRPGKFGIRKRTCLCGEKLPTTALDGRDALPAKCKNDRCQADLYTKEATPITISVIGGPSSGKTSFIMSAMHELKEKVAPKQAWKMEFLHTSEEKIINDQASALTRGQYPNKTIEQKPFAYNVKLSSKEWKRPRLLYMYDPAGEAYSNSDNLREHKYLDYIDGYVLIIDPFAVPEVSLKYEQEHNLQDVNPSATLPEDTYHTFMIHIANQYQVKEDEKISVPIAIVINKVDAFNLENDIAATTIPNNMNMDDEKIENEQCKAFLNSVGYRTLINQIESKFKTSQFFSSSSANINEATKNRSSKIITWLMDQK